MILTIMTSEKRLVDQLQVEELFVPGAEGQLDLLEGHANFVTPLETGVMRWRWGNTWHSGAISRGFLEVLNNNVTILADVAEASDDINLDRAKAALAKARTKIEEGGIEPGDFRKYSLKLARAMARTRAAGSSEE